MITYDTRNGSLVIKDLGRIAARYYIRHSSIEIFNQEMKPRMSHADVLAMLSMSTEVTLQLLVMNAANLTKFDQIQVRESEIPELERLMENAPCAVKVRCLQGTRSFGLIYRPGWYGHKSWESQYLASGLYLSMDSG